MTKLRGEQVGLFDQDTWSGKTSLEPSLQTKEKTSESSSKKQQESSKKMPLFLDVRNGHLQDASWEMGGQLLGEYTMPSFGESPREENESHLSQILEEDPLPKYSLSAKACDGILRRAARKGKELPPELEKALVEQSASKNELENRGGAREY